MRHIIEKTIWLVLLISLTAMVPVATGKIIYVDADAAGENDGSSWADAYNYLQDALADADSSAKPVEIHVAQGIYKPDQGSGVTPGDRTATFQLINGVTLKGGYAGFGAPDPNARDIELYETILSGDLAGDDVDVNDACDLLDEPTRAENSYHVLTSGDADETANVNGLTITGGNGNGSSPVYSRGGGMYNDNGKSTATDCTFALNSAHLGGGMYNNDSGPTLTNCMFIANAAYRGGGIYNRCGSRGPTLINCTFTRNWATTFGGGTCNWENRSTLIRCTFTGNRAGDAGGAIHNYSDDRAFPTLVNCTFSSNFATLCGGVYNTADDTSCTPTLTNCILWGNNDNGGMDESAQLYFYYGPDPVINYCCIQGWAGDFGGIGNIDADPCFADPNSGDYHLKSQAGRWEPESQSWVQDDVTSLCIDAGDPLSPIGYEPFPNGGVINMGAYGGTAEASKSYFGEPVCETIVAGDINGDCKVNFMDFSIMALHWLEER